MAIGLSDVKKNKPKLTQKKATQQNSKEKTKPWEKASALPLSKKQKGQKPKPQKQVPRKDQEDSTPPLNSYKEASFNISKLVGWGQKVKVYPQLEIPIPEFLLTKK